MQVDVYIQIKNILELDIGNDKKAELIKKVFDGMVFEMVKLIYKKSE